MLLPVSLKTDLTALERIRHPGLGATNAWVQRSWLSLLPRRL